MQQFFQLLADHVSSFFQTLQYGSVNALILCFAIGAILASIAAYYHKNYIGRLVRYLLREKATDPQSAKTLSDVGLQNNRLFRFALRKKSTLRRVITVIDGATYAPVAANGNGNAAAIHADPMSDELGTLHTDTIHTAHAADSTKASAQTNIPQRQADMIRHKTDEFLHTANAVQHKADAVQDKVDVTQDQADASRHNADTIQDQADASQHAANAMQDQADASQHTANAMQDQADASQHAANAIQDQADANQHAADAMQDQADASQQKVDTIQQKTGNIGIENCPLYIAPGKAMQRAIRSYGKPGNGAKAIVLTVLLVSATAVLCMTFLPDLLGMVKNTFAQF